MTKAPSDLENLLVSFDLTDPLRDRLYLVLAALPSEVQRDFIEDDRFCIRPLSREKSCETLLALPLRMDPAAVVLSSRSVWPVAPRPLGFM